MGESQLVKVATPFLVDSRSSGGIGLSAAQYGIVYGTLGMICLTLGGILGGVAAAKFGLKRLIWIMALCMNIPISVYIFLSFSQPMPFRAPLQPRPLGPGYGPGASSGSATNGGFPASPEAAGSTMN